MAISPDGKIIASSSSDLTIKFWDSATGVNTSTIPGFDFTTIPLELCFSPDGKTLAGSPNDGTIKLWNVADSSLLATLAGNELPVYLISFSPDSTKLVSCRHQTVTLWDLSKKDILYTIDEDAHSATFSPDGTILATISANGKNTIKLWNAKNGTHINTFSFTPEEGSEEHFDIKNPIAFSPNGKILVSTLVKPAILLWDLTPLYSFVDLFNTLTIDQVLLLKLVKEATDNSEQIDLSNKEHIHLGAFYSSLPEEIRDLVKKYFKKS